MEFDWHSGGIYGRHAGCATRVCFYEALKEGWQAYQAALL